MENKKEKELGARDIVRIVRKEIIANRNETTALRAEIAVMRTELSGMHKVMEENKLFIQSMALSLKAVREAIERAGEGLDSFFVDMREGVKEIIPAMVEMRECRVATKNIDAEFGGDETVNDEYKPFDDVDDDDADKNTPTARTKTEHDTRCDFTTVALGKRHRCCLEPGHKGDHLYKCASVDCPGYPWPPCLCEPHPMNTCGKVLDSLRKLGVDEIPENR